MVKYTETIVADELLECVWPFCGVGAWKVNTYVFFNFLKLI